MLNRYVPRNEYEKQAKFNQDGYKPTPDEISRFPSHPKEDKGDVDNSMDYIQPILLEHTKKNSRPILRPPKCHGRKIKTRNIVIT